MPFLPSESSDKGTHTSLIYFVHQFSCISTPGRKIEKYSTIHAYYMQEIRFQLVILLLPFPVFALYSSQGFLFVPAQESFVSQK